jgi:uncharacterized membrane protein required for colicin V production
MNKMVFGAIAGVLLIGAIAIFVINQQDTVTVDTISNDSPDSITRPAVQAIPNTFSIMSPEEIAAAEEAARLAAEAALLASTTTTSTATSTDSTDVDETKDQEVTN